MSYIPISIYKQYPSELLPFTQSFLEFYYEQIFSEFSWSVDEAEKLRWLLSYQSEMSYIITNEYKIIPPNISLCIAAVSYFNAILSSPTTTTTTTHTHTHTKHNTTTNINDNNTYINNIQHIKSTFFTSEKQLKLFHLLIHRLIRYTNTDLTFWSDTPEEFYNIQQENNTLESYKNTLKNVSEILFLNMLDEKGHNSDPSPILQQLLIYLQDIQSQHILLSYPTSTANTTQITINRYLYDEVIMFWDSIYLCCGLSVSYISSYIPTSEWYYGLIYPLLTGILTYTPPPPPTPKHVSNIHMVSTTSQIQLKPGYISTGQSIICIRILWLLSCWLYHLDSNIIPSLLECIQNILQQAINNHNNYSTVDYMSILYANQLLHNILISEQYTTITTTPTTSTTTTTTTTSTTNTNIHMQRIQLLTTNLNLLSCVLVNVIKEMDSKVLLLDTFIEIIDVIEYSVLISILHELPRYVYVCSVYCVHSIVCIILVSLYVLGFCMLPDVAYIWYSATHNLHNRIYSFTLYYTSDGITLTYTIPLLI